MDLSLFKEQQLILVGLVAAIVIGAGVMAYRRCFTGPAAAIVVNNVKTAEPALLVHVCGAVGREGVFKLRPGDRVIDALKAAGGVLPAADLAALNLAENLKAGEKIIVPLKIMTADRGAGPVASQVNINTANVEAFDSLPGVGRSTAEKIVEHRRRNGPFQRIEQIMEIPRFGKAKFERIKDQITI